MAEERSRVLAKQAALKVSDCCVTYRIIFQFTAAAAEAKQDGNYSTVYLVVSSTRLASYEHPP